MCSMPSSSFSSSFFCLFWQRGCLGPFFWAKERNRALVHEGLGLELLKVDDGDGIRNNSGKGGRPRQSEHERG